MDAYGENLEETDAQMLFAKRTSKQQPSIPISECPHLPYTVSAKFSCLAKHASLCMLHFYLKWASGYKYSKMYMTVFPLYLSFSISEIEVFKDN